ncbi:hypothetical protein HO173_011407 [Letharia columbiana]|uniref:Uncharacterized protein n=1 Tax=Letharia columbiana TaxID=112416 RepID=A0A8H6FJA5_9LECA|nr:uncharacterized protein HO173_011407 [Letharia columbiana]KAF6229552.1 hypothetical protein HO173_011407 [Letharia columbiana]
MSVTQESLSLQFSPADIVLSCTICQETLSTIYADDDQNNGLIRKDREDSQNGKVTKLWLTECAHLTCGKHLPGGGAPFHSIQEVPRAPCPLCSIEKDDHSNKALFFINGTSKGQYDENIPDVYFQMPPIELSGGDPGLEALRFHYLSLLRSGTKTREKLIGLTKALKRWEDKKPEIVRSLSSVAPLRDELLSAGRRLMVLGEDVSSIETTLKLAGVSLTEGLRPQQQMDIRSQHQSMDLKPAGQKSSPLDGGSRIARGSAADLDCLKQGAGIFKGRSGVTQQDSMQQHGSSSKRKRVDSRSDTEHQTEYALRGRGFGICRSRDQMPPPPIPMPQPSVYMARVPSSDMHGLDYQHDHVNATHFQRAPITPQRHPSQGGLSRSMLAPGSSMEPSNTSLAGARTNNGQPRMDRRQSPRANTGTAGPVYARGGWQPPPESFDTEHSLDFSSPSSSLPSTGQPPARRFTGYHQGSLMFPIELGDQTIDPSSRSYRSVSSDGSTLYYRRQSALAMQSQLESPAPSRNHDPSPNREGRITLSRTPSVASRHSSDRGIGLSSHVRSSSRQTNHPSGNSSSHRQQLVITTPAHQHAVVSAHFPMRQPAYSSSLPSLGEANTQIFRRNNSFDSGPTPVNGEMRPYSSTNGENILVARDPDRRASQNRGRAPLMEWQASGPRRRANR